MTNHLEIGKLGEDIACRFLEERGFRIIERNYWKKWGEIDIIASKRGIVRLIEVKSVARVTLNKGKIPNNKGFQPEDAVDSRKIKRLKRVIQSYLLDLKRKPLDFLPEGEVKWQFDIIAVFLVVDKKQAKVRFRENVVI